jgi:hypothetical protein
MRDVGGDRVPRTGIMLLVVKGVRNRFMVERARVAEGDAP